MPRRKTLPLSEVDPERPIADQLEDEQPTPEHDPFTDDAPDGSAEPLPPPIEGHSYLPPADETKTDKENRGAGRKGRKPREEPVARTFALADPAETLGRLLISDHYPELAHQPIRYVFTSNPSEVEGQPIICKPSKLAGLSAWLANGSEDGEASPFFVIVISQSHWDSMPMRGREAFLDGALSVLKVSKTGALKMGQLDIRESSAVIARYGMYSAKLKSQAKLIRAALDQPALELQEGAA